MSQTIRHHWTGLKGRRALNFNWDAIDHDSVVLVTASEYALNAAAPETSQRFVGAASITVANVTPHGPPYDPNHGVTFVVDVAWGAPLDVVTDVVLLDRPRGSQHPPLDWRRLAFTVQHQLQTNWCWCAVTVSVANFYGASLTQCTFANTFLSRTDCCTASGGSGPCNQQARLGDALRTAGHLASVSPSQPSFATIQGEIDGGRPACVRIEWSGGGGHFVVVDGYLAQDQFVGVEDPWSGATDVRLSTLNSSYLGTGTATHTYLTR
jgi:hypothetical protein